MIVLISQKFRYSTLGAVSCTTKSLGRAESLDVKSCSNSSSQLDTSRLSSLNGLVELSVLKVQVIPIIQIKWLL